MQRGVYIHDDTARRVNAIATREGVTATAVLRSLIERGLAEYQREFGEISIEGVSRYAPAGGRGRPRRASDLLGERAPSEPDTVAA